MMDFHAIANHGMVHVCTTHRLPEDDSPVQLISEKQLAHYQRVEAEFQELLRTLSEESGAPPEV